MTEQPGPYFQFQYCYPPPNMAVQEQQALCCYIADSTSTACASSQCAGVRLWAGLAVSGAFDVNGKAWLWGFGTNSQLGKGNDDSDEEV